MAEKTFAVKKPETKSSNFPSHKPKKPFESPLKTPYDQVIFLQRTIGNREVQQLLAEKAAPLIQRAPPRCPPNAADYDRIEITASGIPGGIYTYRHGSILEVVNLDSRRRTLRARPREIFDNEFIELAPGKNVLLKLNRVRQMRVGAIQEEPPGSSVYIVEVIPCEHNP